MGSGESIQEATKVLVDLSDVAAAFSAFFVLVGFHLLVGAIPANESGYPQRRVHPILLSQRCPPQEHLVSTVGWFSSCVELFAFFVSDIDPFSFLLMLVFRSLQKLMWRAVK